jgi:pimeloyl-ACP methyl ester carboxylesterase
LSNVIVLFASGMNPEHLLTIGDVELCVQTVGRPDDPAILLVHGACASMLWCVALIAGVDHPDRVASLTFLSTTTGDPDLPDPTPEFRAATAASGPDVADRGAVVEHGVALQRAVPGAELLVLDRTGHELPRQRWDAFVGALLRHTAPRS